MRLNDGIFPLMLKFKFIYQFFAERDFCVKKSQHGIVHAFEYIIPTLRCLDFFSNLIR